MVLFFINIQVYFIFNNIFEGLIWFFLFVVFVIINDIFVYICGIIFGCIQFIKFLFKKMVEGFIGVWFLIMVVGFGFIWCLFCFNYFICFVINFVMSILQDIYCDFNFVFIFCIYMIFEFFFLFFGYIVSIMVVFMYFYILVWVMFVLLIVLFGGFFVLGFKRIFKFKDFGDLIFGYGGMMDCMDCQFIMGMFVFFYYQIFIVVWDYNFGVVLDMLVIGLGVEDQVYVVKGMLQIWVRDGVIFLMVSIFWEILFVRVLFNIMLIRLWSKF